MNGQFPAENFDHRRLNLIRYHIVVNPVPVAVVGRVDDPGRRVLLDVSSILPIIIPFTCKNTETANKLPQTVDQR